MLSVHFKKRISQLSVDSPDVRLMIPPNIGLDCINGLMMQHSNISKSSRVQAGTKCAIFCAQTRQAEESAICRSPHQAADLQCGARNWPMSSGDCTALTQPCGNHTLAKQNCVESLPLRLNARWRCKSLMQHQPEQAYDHVLVRTMIGCDQ